MKRTHMLATLLAAALLVLAPLGRADVIGFEALLDGASEFPPNASSGTGVADALLDTLAHTLSLHVTFSDLLGLTTASHIHCCVDPGAALPTVGIATTVPTFAGFPLGVTSGTYDTVLDLTLATSFNPAFVTTHGGTVPTAEAALIAGLIAGDAYLNIHSNLFPAGEIRGFFSVVPAPATATLLIASLAVAGAIRRRRGASPSHRAGRCAAPPPR